MEVLADAPVDVTDERNSALEDSSLLPGTWHVLIDEDGVAIRVQQDKARRARRRLVGLHNQGKALTFERLLDVANIVEVRQRVAGAVPAGVERQGVLLEHPLEQPDGTGLILQDQPVTGGVAEDGAEAELLVERAGTWQVLDSKADGEVSQSHVHSPYGKGRSSSESPLAGHGTCQTGECLPNLANLRANAISHGTHVHPAGQSRHRPHRRPPR